MPTLALQDPRPSSTALFSPPSSSSSTTTSAATSSLMSSIPPTTTPCPIPSCAPSTRSCPPCESSYECRLSVIQSSCQCPVASCVKKVDFDTGNSDGSIGPGTGVSNGSSGGRSILGPVLGSLTGLIIILVIVFFIARRKRQQRRDVDGNRLIDQEGQFYKFDGSVDAFDDTNKKIHESNQVWRGHRQVLNLLPSRIATSDTLLSLKLPQPPGHPTFSW
ncbi:hypothetical protein BC939DRAFT_132872 [Gamsiella multidivaricata]|uniref:uncharacterized protein n=1 Tax=Gamsiella multidivaricata TaxID=101098 RepID=UPI00221E6F5F|nr:uncharacterized protein BC939DRAFT_132872 [Gamsiella multidivaricata]KAI7825204.1 hypothetical protein BC939DRAFT_132872 [Gamsiella multidivaricata]